MKVWIALFLLLAARAAFAADKPDLLAVDSAFSNGQYEQTEILALRILNSRDGLTVDDVARMNLTAGYAVIMLGREADARVYFSRALDAVPTLTLDPVAVSPKFRVVFDDVKARHQAPQISGPRIGDVSAQGNSGNSQRPSPPRESPVSQTRARLMNLALPGSGQWLEGRRIWGAGFLLAQAASVGYLIYEVGQLHDARENYLDATDPLEIKSTYHQYNLHTRKTWAAGIATGFIYVAAQADLIWRVPHTQTSLSIVPAGGNQLALIVRW